MNHVTMHKDSAIDATSGGTLINLEHLPFATDSGIGARAAIGLLVLLQREVAHLEQGKAAGEADAPLADGFGGGVGKQDLAAEGAVPLLGETQVDEDA